MKETLYTICGFDFSNEYMIMVATVITAIATFFTTITTFFFIRESYLMRKFQNMPEISMYLKFAEAKPAMLYLMIENIGTGVARNVKFEILKNYEHYKYPQDDLAQKGIIKSGLENFYPKQVFKYFVNFTGENWEEKRNEQITIQVSYGSSFFNQTHKTFSMSLEQYAGGSQAGDTYPALTALSIEKIQKDISALHKILENNFSKE